MGTSKGYIAPTTLHWSTAKRAVTSFINNRDYDSKAKAASKYATAMKQDLTTNSDRTSTVIGKVLGLGQSLKNQGIEKTLKD